MRTRIIFVLAVSLVMAALGVGTSLAQVSPTIPTGGGAPQPAGGGESFVATPHVAAFKSFVLRLERALFLPATARPQQRQAYWRFVASRPRR